jgi:cytochrome c556
MKPTPALAALLFGLLSTLPASAQGQFATHEQAIKYRQGAFSVMAAHFSRVAMMAQGIQPYDAKVAQDNVDIIAGLAKLPFTAFPAGSDKGAPNRSTPQIWGEAAKFKSASDRMISDVAKLEAAAKTGNVDALKVAVGAVGQSCKGCHDSYRNSSRSVD